MTEPGHCDVCGIAADGIGGRRLTDGTYHVQFTPCGHETQQYGERWRTWDPTRWDRPWEG